MEISVRKQGALLVVARLSVQPAPPIPLVATTRELVAWEDPPMSNHIFLTDLC
jgi:hypothetical protein